LKVFPTASFLKNAGSNDRVKVDWGLLLLAFEETFSQLLGSALEQFGSLDSFRELVLKELLDVNGG
jgi:hypothetical protein